MKKITIKVENSNIKHSMIAVSTVIMNGLNFMMG